MKMAFRKRLSVLQKKIPLRQAFLIADPTDISYLTGFGFLSSKQSEREAYLVVTKKVVSLIHSSFSPVEKLTGLKYLSGCNFENIESALGDHKQLTLLFNPRHIFANEYLQLRKITKVELLESEFKEISQMRMVKDKSELANIKEACRVSSRILEELVELFRIGRMGKGITELELANLLEDELIRAGVRDLAFPTIVAFGENTALPHHQPTSKELEKEMAVLIDFGGAVGGYCADMTRSFWFGKNPDHEYLKIKKLVMEAYQAAIKLLGQKKVKLTAKNIDNSVRQVIKDGGYGPQFIHTTGHGLGLDIHEQPSLNSGNDQVIKLGMVLTIEPGIYLPGKFGFRYENTVLVSAKPKNAKNVYVPQTLT